MKSTNPPGPQQALRPRNEAVRPLDRQFSRHNHNGLDEHISEMRESIELQPSLARLFLPNAPTPMKVTAISLYYW